ncbi:MAG: NRDE family protein, partial [Colwellia sp.]|nr:NRDE family protein [Colwellia sp.]
KQNSEMTEQLTNTSNQYNGFNLVYGQLNNLVCFDSVSQQQRALSVGFHSLCNGALDDIWPKMALGQTQLANAINTFPEQSLDIDELFNLMLNAQQAKTQHLPKTGVPLDWEQLLSSIFIISPEYGTRTTNIITQDNDGNIAIYDRSFDEQGKCINEQQFSINQCD